MTRFSVRNTFINILDGDEAQPQKTKRSTSLPAPQRFCEEVADALCTKLGCADSCSSSSTEVLVSPEPASTSGGSWTPVSVEEEVTCHQVSAEWSEVEAFDHICSWTPPAQTLPMPSFILVAPPPTAAAAGDPEALQHCNTVSTEVCADVLCEVADVDTKPPSKAAMKENGVLCRRLVQALEKVKFFLATNSWVSTVEVTNDQFEYCMKIRGKAGALAHQSAILDVAKSAITMSISRTSTLQFLVCSEETTDPFVCTPTSMAATVCSVKNDQKMCWDFLQRGFCHYGDRCHWRHPKAQKRIVVEIEPVEELLSFVTYQ